jgi:phage FluMu gp28-like protein
MTNQIVQRNQSLKSLRDADLTGTELTSLLASSPALWAETLTELAGQQVELEPFQVNFLNDKSTYRIANKSRQIGFSTLIALETTHKAATSRNYNANIVSTTQEEAADKLMTGGMLWASIPMDFEPLGFKPIKYKDAADALAFHMPPYTSTVTSKPGTSAIRGGKKDMYYDEAAFIKEFAMLFQAGIPAITRGEGRITVVSTPYGESGLYHELWQAEKWSHHAVPWWESRFMVKDGIVDDASNYDAVNEAIMLAPEMDTLSRVEKFGSEKLREILEVGVRGDLMIFQTEYECQFIDEAEAYFPWELVNSCMDKQLQVWKHFPAGYEPQGDISIGVDLAKKRDQTVFTVVEHLEEDGIKHKKVLYVYATQADYEDQFYDLKRLVEITRARRVSIDATGPGAMFFEKAQREGFGANVMVEGIVFTNNKKETWATQFKGDLQTGAISYPNHSEFLNQLHGIKRTKTLSNFFKFAGDPDDYFWSLMLGMYGEGWRPVKFYKLGR